MRRPKIMNSDLEEIPFHVEAKLVQLSTIKVLRLLQLLFIFLILWFVYWAHVYEITVWSKTFLESIRSSILNVVLYSISILALLYLEIRVKRVKSVTTIKRPPESLQDLERENRPLRHEPSKSEQTLSSRIGAVFLFVGALVLSASYFISSTVLAFIGLGLTFWGGLFLFARPVRFVKSDIVVSTTISSYAAIDRITEDLDYTGRPIYVPPYPKGAYLPDHLKGLKEMIVYVPAQDVVAMPTIEEMARKRFLVKNPKGICIPAPGYGLASLIEKELKDELTQVDTDRLFSSLPTIITRGLELAREFEISKENDLVHIKALDSVYQNLYSPELGLKSIHSIGCPLTSAVACALAKTTTKLVTIVKDVVSPDLRSIETWYKTLEA